MLFHRFPGGSAGKESACNERDLGSIPGLGRSPGEGKGYPLQDSGLENSMDCIVYGVEKSQTGMRNFHFHFLLLMVFWEYTPTGWNWKCNNDPCLLLCSFSLTELKSYCIQHFVFSPPPPVPIISSFPYQKFFHKYFFVNFAAAEQQVLGFMWYPLNQWLCSFLDHNSPKKYVIQCHSVLTHTPETEVSWNNTYPYHMLYTLIFFFCSL